MGMGSTGLDVSLTLEQSPVKSNLKKWGRPLLSATTDMGTKHFSTSNSTVTLLIVEI